MTGEVPGCICITFLRFVMLQVVYLSGPSFSRMFSRTSASRGAAQCCDAFKAEVSFWCCPDRLFSFQSARGINPSIFLTDKKSGGGPLFRVGKNIFYCPLTYNGNDRSHFARSGEKYIFSSVFPPLPITAFRKGCFGHDTAVFKNIFFGNADMYLYVQICIEAESCRTCGSSPPHL